MNDDTIKFYACSNACANCDIVKSPKTWWPDCRILWGHKVFGGGKCEGILVSRSDAERFLIFASHTDIGDNETYQMDITRIKSCFGDLWFPHNFGVSEFWLLDTK